MFRIRGAHIAALALVLIGACVGQSACSRRGGRPPCPPGKLCFEARLHTDPTSLDPPRTELVIENWILEDLMTGLTTSGPDGKPMPGIARSWTTSKDGLVWTFKLRKALWSDGAPVTAEDFVFTFRRLEDPAIASAYAYLFYLIKGAEAVNKGKAPPEALGVRALDPETLQITLVHPAPYLPAMLSHNIAEPVPEHVVRRFGDAWVQPGHYVSDGPYTLSSWVIGDRVELKKNPLFYDAANTCFDRVDYFDIPDGVSAEREFKAGDLDEVYQFDSRRARYLRRPDQIPDEVHTHAILDTVYLAFNTHLKVLADPRVRRALSMSIDRDFITSRLLGAGEVSAYTFVPPGTNGYQGPPPPAWAAWSFAARTADARRLLAQAGYGPGHPLHLDLKLNNASALSIGPLLQADWRGIGVDISLSPEESQILYQDLNIRDFQLGLADWSADFNDPLTFLSLLQSATGAQNYGDYQNPAYDALLARADHEPDARARAALLASAEAMALADTSVAPIYTGSGRFLVGRAVTGWVDNLAANNPKRFLCLKDAALRRAGR